MPNLKIRIDPYSEENSFFKNNIRIGKKSHSPFRNLTGVPLLNWIYKLPSLAGNEMNDNYDLVVSAPAFESALIRLVMKRHPLCSSLVEEPFEVAQSVSDRLETAAGLKDRYGQSKSFPPRSDLVSEDFYDGTTRIRLDRVMITIQPSAEESMEFTNDGIRWCTQDKSEVFGIIRERFVDIPFLIESHRLLEEERWRMSESDRDALDSLLLTEPRIVPSVVRELEVGTSSVIGIEVFPKGIECPPLTITVDDPAFVVTGQTLTAVGAGRGTVSISREDDPEQVFTFAVYSFERNEVTSVQISVNADVMGTGSRQEVFVTMDPADADNAHTLTVRSETPDVLSLVNGNIVVAKNPGVGIVAAYCGKCSDSVKIEVRPGMEAVKLDMDNNQEYRVGESAVVKLVFTPSDAFHHEIRVESSDSSILAVESCFNDQYRIKAKSIGHCELALIDENGHVLQKQAVHVISTLYQPRRKPSFTAFVALAFLIAHFVFFDGSFPGYGVVLIALLAVALFLSLWSVFKLKRHYLLSIVVAVISIWALYNTILEVL